MVASETGTETVWQVAMEQSKYWKNVDPKACEPREGMVCILYWQLCNSPVLQSWKKSRSRYPVCSFTSEVVLVISRGSFTEILKAHRQHYLYTKHGMLQIPLMTEELEERFGTQIMCSLVIS